MSETLRGEGNPFFGRTHTPESKAKMSEANQGGKPKMSKPCSSKYLGVSWRPGHNRWVAYVFKHQRRVWAQYFDEEIDAAKARDDMARVWHGAAGRYNFPRGNELGATS